MRWIQCLETGTVKKKSPDKEQAKSLLKMAKLRFKDRNKSVTEDNASLVVEGIYECILELIHALLSVEGFKTDSHECAIQFLKEFYNFSDDKIDFLDRVRKMRNAIKYEGLLVDVSRANDIVSKEREIYFEVLSVVGVNLE